MDPRPISVIGTDVLIEAILLPWGALLQSRRRQTIPMECRYRMVTFDEEIKTNRDESTFSDLVRARAFFSFKLYTEMQHPRSIVWCLHRSRFHYL